MAEIKFFKMLHKGVVFFTHTHTHTQYVECMDSVLK